MSLDELESIYCRGMPRGDVFLMSLLAGVVFAGVSIMICLTAMSSYSYYWHTPLEGARGIMTSWPVLVSAYCASVWSLYRSGCSGERHDRQARRDEYQTQSEALSGTGVDLLDYVMAGTRSPAWVWRCPTVAEARQRLPRAWDAYTCLKRVEWAPWKTVQEVPE